MRLETFSYLPGLSSEQLAEQIRSILGRHRPQRHYADIVVSFMPGQSPDPG